MTRSADFPFARSAAGAYVRSVVRVETRRVALAMGSSRGIAHGGDVGGRSSRLDPDFLSRASPKRARTIASDAEWSRPHSHRTARPRVFRRWLPAVERSKYRLPRATARPRSATLRPLVRRAPPPSKESRVTRAPDLEARARVAHSHGREPNADAQFLPARATARRLPIRTHPFFRTSRRASGAPSQNRFVPVPGTGSRISAAG